LRLYGDSSDIQHGMDIIKVIQSTSKAEWISMGLEIRPDIQYGMYRSETLGTRLSLGDRPERQTNATRREWQLIERTRVWHIA
jgi:hypothetical protein